MRDRRIQMKKCLILTLCVMICLAAGCAPQKSPTPPGANPDQELASTEPADVTPDTSPDQSTDSAPDQTPGSQTDSPWEIGPDDVTPPSDPPWVREPREERSLSELTENTIQITITMENGGVIVAELYPDLAPQTVRNFVYLARLGFYDGLKFHRIISGFMVQGGCPYTRDGGPSGIPGTGNPGYSIWGEFTENGFVNEVRHVQGVLSMARGDDMNSAGSQFFIVHGTSPHLNNKYAAFGRVISGLDVVDEIAATPNSGDNGAVAPEDMPVIRSITVDDDIELPVPEKLPK